MDEKQLSDIIQRNLAPSDYNTNIKLHIYYRNKKLKNLIVHNRFYKATEQFSVVYQYTCDRGEYNSSQKYIEYTESTITERMRNHAQHGSIINHLRECHSISKIKTVELLKSVKILARGATKQELLILEAFHIKEEQPSLNGQKEERDRVLKIF